MTGPLPSRVSAEAKELVLNTVDEAVAGGFTHTWVCSLWQVSSDRVHRWRARRRDLGTLGDLAPGGTALHALRPDEIAEILAIVEEWGTVDGSHRKLAHRGSYEGRVWVSPATVRRVMAAHALLLPARPQTPREPKRDLPEWLVLEPNRIWAWDVTHFSRARRCVFAIIDAISRYWIDTLVSIEETSTQVQVIFDRAMLDQGLVNQITPERLELPLDDPCRPVLVAMSDNGPPMTSHATREFMALMAIWQHRGRPHTPTDQAVIESLFGHVKGEWPHLNTIDDPAVLETELERVRHEYNTIRLHQSIGYVTPDDEHHGRGEAIRQARIEGLRQAREQRVAYHRRNNTNQPPGAPS